MKQPYRWLVFLLLGLLWPASTPGRNPERLLLFSITSQNTARLGLINTSKRSLDLVITNEKGENIYMKRVTGQENFFQLFSLNNMPDGRYKVSVNDLDELESKQFVISNSQARLVKPKEENVPAFHRYDDNTLIVSYLNDQQSAVNIFFMQQGEVVFEERGISDLALSKRYSLKQLPYGEYEVKLYSNGRIYTYNFVK